jgi:hypothetical protein
LYNNDSTYLNDNRVSFIKHDLIDSPLKYNPFVGNEYEVNKLSFSGIKEDSIINSNYYCDFSLVGSADSIEASLAAQINYNNNNLEITSIQYKEIIELNENKTGDSLDIKKDQNKITINKKAIQNTKNNVNKNSDRTNKSVNENYNNKATEKTEEKKINDGPKLAPLH